MNRRDFLRMRTDARRSVFELSCERLYMVYADTRDANAPGGSRDSSGRGDERDAASSVSGNWSHGEPPTVVERATAEEVFRNLEGKLESFDTLRVLESGWLSADQAFGTRVRVLLASFEARGGRVEFPE